MAGPDDDEIDLERVEIASAQRSGQDDAANPKLVRDKTRKVRNAMRDAVDFWSMVMGSEDGRRAVWALLQMAHPFETIFGIAGGFPQAEASWLHAGRQGAGFDQYLHLLALVPELTTLMLIENEPRLVTAMKALSEKPRRPRKGPSQPLR